MITEYKIKKRGRNKRELPKLTPEQQQLVLDHRHIAGIRAHAAILRTNGNTGCFTKEDLISVGYFALAVAAIDYIPNKGASFSTYAHHKINGYLIHALDDNSRMVRINRKIQSIRKKVKELSDKGIPDEEVCETLGITQEDIYFCEISWLESWASFDYISDDNPNSEVAWDDPKMDIELTPFTDSQRNAILNLSDDQVDLLMDYYYGSGRETPEVLTLIEELKKS